MRKLVLRGGSTYSMVGTAEMSLQRWLFLPTPCGVSPCGLWKEQVHRVHLSLLYAHTRSEPASKTTRIPTRYQGFDHSLFLAQHHTLLSSPN